MRGKAWADFAADEPEMASKGQELIYRRGDGEGFLVTVAGVKGLPRLHPINVGVVDGHLYAFVQAASAKTRDLQADGRYALHPHQDPAAPDEFMVRGRVQLVQDADLRARIASDWFFNVADDYPLYELLIEHALLGERGADEWPPRYRSWRPRG